jgi:PAS domain S-box-containing protein
MDLSQYRLETLRTDGEFVLYRALPNIGAETPPPSILALSPILEHPAPGTVKKLKHELSFKDDLDPAWAIRPIALIKLQSRTTLLFEDLHGEPLDRVRGRPLELGQFLSIGIAIAASLGQIHRRGLVHRDVKPSNVFTNSAMDRAWLMGFGVASRLPRERQAAEPPEFIAGTLAYMAPEQTGRMNRSTDSRSDLYALGITLYELLTGSLPFTASDPMEWVHCHIARQPQPPAERMSNIPHSVSAFITKLLAKTPEERYQTAAGVEADLRRCLADWNRERSVRDFALGQHDRPEGLLISENLYGREREVDMLLASFDRIVKGGTPELVLVSGYSGIGKSSVVNELHKALVPPRGLFASGKFDQLKRDIPYATVAQALQTLVRQLLGKPEAELNRWRDQFRQALDPNGVLVIGLIPELKFIIGEQPAVPDVSPAATKARFQAAIRGLIGVFARAEHPLALFLDDLQWLDAGTLDLLENILIESELQHLLLVGAYRDNEVDAAHPLTRTLSALRRSGSVVKEIVLGPLTHEDLNQWFADALQAETERARPLAKLVHTKTAGNPFFAGQVLHELVDNGLLIFDSAHPGWRWDLEAIQAKGYTENVVDLMVGKLSRLAAPTQEALKTFACLGNEADTSTLALIHGTSEEQLHSDLWEALRMELIVRSDDSYRYVHDRVQEAAYTLVSEEQRAPEHLRIGRILARQIGSPQSEEAVFEIVGHFNRAAALLVSQEERDEVAALNLAAGKRAKKAAAYVSALNYLTAGAALVASEEWRPDDLAFELEFHRAECEFLTGEVTSAEQRLTILSSYASTHAERAAVVCLQADVYYALQRPDRGLQKSAEFLRQAGLPIPLRPVESEARAAFDRICSRLDGIGIDEVAALPLMTDPASRAILDVLARISTSAASVDSTFDVLIICSAVALTLDRGNHDASCWAFAVLGYLAAWRYGNFEASFRFGQMGYELIERTGLRRFEGFVCLNFSTLIMPWAKHVSSCRPVIRRTFEVAHNTGDRIWAVQSCNILLSNLLMAGDSLIEAEREAEASLAFCRRDVFADYTDTVNTQLALIRNLRGLTRQFGLLDYNGFNELQIENHFQSQPHVLGIECWYWVRKLQARFLAEDYLAALDAARRARGLLEYSPGMLERAEHELYSGLAHAAVCESLSDDDGRQHFEAMVAHHRELEIWALHCPENFENRAALLAAEIARIGARDYDAIRLYEHAIKSARESGFVNSEALALEVAARFYAARGFDKIAKTYLRDARYGYEQWGADGKVRQLDRLYPDLKQEQPTSDPTSTITAPVEGLDLATLIRVSQAVSSEIELEKLFDTVMRNAMEHAGAERGLLIFPYLNHLQVKAEAVTVGDRVAVRTAEASISSTDIPESVLRYVMRTREQLILADASVPTSFSTDEYLREKRPRSVACLPLLKQGVLVALLYLENKLVSNVFSPARLQILEVIASQAAISLENSRLYHEIQHAQEALRRSEKQLRDVIETMPVMAFTALLDGSTDFVNRRFSDFTGLTAGDVDSQRGTTVHPEDLEPLARKWQTCLETGEPFEGEVRVRSKDGHYRWFLARGSPLRDEKGNVLKWFGSLTDIEDRKHAEERLRNENVVLREEIDTGAMFEEIVGASAALQAVLAKVAKVAPTDSTGLITGETGTGKELIARAIHKRSRRSGRPFVSVNCAALAPTLIASELFGHEKGAFTGATQRRLGRFELADGGTLFLDEVGELPPDVQVTLLRVLQEREFERIGGGQPIRVDVRVIAATNRNLKTAIANGTFRSDLFYRLDVFPIEVPPLRDRKDDILMLVEYFVQRYAARMAKKIRTVDKKTLHLLQSYDWPGNIRELTNIIERSVILASGDVLSVDEMWLRNQTSLSTSRVEASPAFKVEGGQSEREIIEAALAETRGRVSGPSGAAAKLRIPASTLSSRIKALKIDRQLFKFG